MPGLSPISGTKEALLGLINRKRKSIKGQGLLSLIQQKELSDLFSMVANSKKRRTSFINPGELAVADRLELSASLNRIGSNNAQLSLSRLDTADAGLSGAREVVGRLSELSARATDPTLNSADRSALNAEAQSLKTELSRIQSYASFNGQAILQGSSISTFTGESYVTTTDADLSQAITDISGLDLSTQAGANAALASSSTAFSSLATETAQLGASYNQLSRASEFAVTRANSYESSADNIRVNALGEIGSLFGPSLAGAVNSLLGIS
jgi:flagellin